MALTQIKGSNIEDGTVVAADVADNAVSGAKIAMGSDAAGDILTYNGTDYIRLAKGTAEQVLKMNSGATAVEWGTDAGGIAIPGSSVAGDTLYHNGTIYTRLAKGTASQVLTMNSGATAPEWAAAAAGGVDGITSSANATAMTISADEEVNMPLQPSFRARRTTMMNNVTGINALSVVDIIFDVEDWDIGSNYNTSNGTFTAPITGKYFLTFGGVYLTGFTFNNTSVTGQIFTSNRMHRSHQTSIWEQSGGAYSMTINGSAVADMEVGDTAKVQCGASGNSSGQTVDVYADGSYTSNGYTWFAGWLLG